MSEDASPVGQPSSEQVKLAGIGNHYIALAGALTESGRSAEQLKEILARSISAECVQCGILLTGEELNRLSQAGADTVFSENKLERVRQGYCGRRECNSYFYRLNLAAVPGLDWGQIKTKAQEKLSGGKLVEEKVETVLPKKAPTRLPLGKIALLLGFLFALLLLKWWYWDGSVPLLQKKTTYQVDPKSTPMETSE